MKSSSLALLVLVTLVGGLGCKEEPSPSPSTASAPTAASSTEAPSPAASATPPASASAPAPAASVDAASALVGAWKGSYEAKAGSLTLDPKASPKRWGAAGSTDALGPGTVELTVSATGEVRGKILGALGPATVTGRAEEGSLRASVFPDDPAAPKAMTGVLVGLWKGDVVKAEIRAAGPDATLVREAAVELRRP